MNPIPNDQPSTGMVKWREIASEAIRFWERMRVAYCGVLTVVVLACFAWGWPGSVEKLDLDTLLSFFLLAVLANVLYTLAYIPDVFVQLSEFRPAWRRARWVVLFIGTAFAVVVTRFIALGPFVGRPQ